MDYLWVGLGGLVGANARFLLGRIVIDRLGSSFPYGTFLVNLSGSFAIGLVLTSLLVRGADPAWRLLVVTGFLGGYTTFSTYTFEAVSLIEEGRWARAAVYAIGSTAVGLAACWGGVALGRALAR